MGRNLLSTKKTSKNNDNHNNNNNDNGNNNNKSILALLYLRTLFTQTVSTSARWALKLCKENVEKHLI